MTKLQLKADADGLRIRETPVTGKPIGQLYVGDEIESLESVEETRAKLGQNGKWLNIRGPEAVEGYTAAWLLELAPGEELPEPETTEEETAAEMAFTPTVSALRLRDKPVNGAQVGLVGTGDVLISLEDAADTEAKIGVTGKWLHVKTIYDTEAYAAAWFLEKYEGEIPTFEVQALPGARSILGVNLDIDHPLGKPSAAEMQRMGWVRLKFNVSYDPRKQGDARYGNTDVDYTYSRYIDTIKAYANSGIKILLVLTHQAYGEGAGYYWPTMTTPRWQNLTTKYADMARRIAQKFAGTGLISAYQIWNEQDTKPEHARAAVPIPAADYAHLLSETIKAIKSVDPGATVITGGHVGGPDAGGQYARETLAAMPSGTRPDGIAFHPYGRGIKGHKFSPFGALNESIEKYSAVQPGLPLWITEWGVLDIQGRNELAGDVTDYAKGFLDICSRLYAGRVASAVWYAWADSMDNGYGFTKSDGSPKAPLYDALVK